MRSVMRPLLVLAWAPLLLTACGAESPGTTTAPPAPEAQTCRQDRDCTVGTVCIQGFCEADDSLCLRNADCPEGFACQRETQSCVPAPTPDLGPDLDASAEPDLSPEDLGREMGKDTGPDIEDLPEEVLEDLGQDQGPDLTEDAPADTLDDLSDLPDVAEDLEDPPPDLPEGDMTTDVLDDAVEDAVEDMVEDTADMPGDVVDPGPEDMPDPDDMPIDDMPIDDMPVDDMPDLADMPEDAVEDVEEDTGFVAPPTPEPSTYTYTALEIGGLNAQEHVAFHPGGDYALVLEASNVVHVVDWASGTAVRLVLDEPLGDVIWSDLAFDPSGEFALLVGWLDLDDSSPGVVVRFDDAAWRSLQSQEALSRYELLWNDPIHALRFGLPGGAPLMLARRGTRSPYTAVLRDFDPDTGQQGSFVSQTTTDAGCDDLALVRNEEGGDGVLVVCGHNGGDVHYYSQREGVWAWEANPGNNNLGNTSHVAAHPSGDYALVLSWSGRSIYRFEGGMLNGYSDAPRFSRRAIDGVTFQQEGQRALITGGSWFGNGENIGIMFEYRHDLYTCPRPEVDCEITAVHIPEYSEAPFNAVRNTTLRDAAFRPGCDGGLVVTGVTGFNINDGQIIKFQVDDGRSCEP